MPTVTPGAGSLSFTVTDAEFVNSGDMRLIFSSDAPTILHPNPVSPSSGTLSFTGIAPRRGYGLQLKSDAPSLSIGLPLSTGALSFSSKAPELVYSPPQTVAPEDTSLRLVTYAPMVSPGIAGTVGALSISSAAVTVQINGPIRARVGRLSLSSEAPEVALSGSLAIVGTAIENTNATEVKSNYLIDDKTGFKVKIKHGIYEQYDGVMTRGRSYDIRHPQELRRSPKPERLEGAQNPERTDVFIDTLYPDGVDSDDL